MYTKAWAALCWQDMDHQAHVKAYWNAQFEIATAKAPKAVKEFNSRGCYGAVQQMNPSIKEDLAAYILAGD